jgi:hypothetical protein
VLSFFLSLHTPAFCVSFHHHFSFYHRRCQSFPTGTFFSVNMCCRHVLMCVRKEFGDRKRRREEIKRTQLFIFQTKNTIESFF